MDENKILTADKSTIEIDNGTEISISDGFNLVVNGKSVGQRSKVKPGDRVLIQEWRSSNFSEDSVTKP